MDRLAVLLGPPLSQKSDSLGSLDSLESRLQMDSQATEKTPSEAAFDGEVAIEEGSENFGAGDASDALGTPRAK